MPTPTSTPHPEPRLFHVNLKNNGKVYLLLYKGNKVHVLYDENKNVTNLKFRIDIPNIGIIKRKIDERLNEHKLNPTVLRGISSIISIGADPFNPDEENPAFKRLKLEKEEIEDVSTRELPLDVIRQIGDDLDIHDIFVLMLTSKFLYNSLKKVVFSKIFVDFEKIYNFYETFVEGKTNNFEYIDLGRNAKIFLKDIQNIKVPMDFEEKFVSLFRKHGSRFEDLIFIKSGLIGEEFLKILPDSIRGLKFSFRQPYLNLRLPNNLKSLNIVKLRSLNPEDEIYTLSISTDILPKGIEGINVHMFNSKRVIQQPLLRFIGEFNHRRLKKITFDGKIELTEWPSSLESLKIESIFQGDIQLPKTLVHLMLNSLDTEVFSIYNLTNLKRLYIENIRTKDMRFLPRGLEELYIEKMLDPNIRGFKNEGMPQGLKILDMFDDINSNNDETGPFLEITESFPKSMSIFKCHRVLLEGEETLGGFLNEGMEYLYIRIFIHRYGKLPSNLIYMNMTVDERRIGLEPDINFPESLKIMTIMLSKVPNIHYKLPRNLKELELDVKDGSDIDIPMYLDNLKILQVEVIGKEIRSIDIPNNVESLTINSSYIPLMKALPETVKKFSTGRYQGIDTDDIDDVHVGNIFRYYGTRFLPEGIEEITINEDDFYFETCRLDRFKELRKLEVDVRRRSKPDHKGNTYLLPDNMRYLNLYLSGADKMAHFKLPMDLMKLSINLEDEELFENGPELSRNFMKICYYDERNQQNPTNLLYMLFDKIYESDDEVMFLPKKDFSKLYKGEIVTWFQ